MRVTQSLSSHMGHHPTQGRRPGSQDSAAQQRAFRQLLKEAVPVSEGLRLFIDDEEPAVRVAPSDLTIRILMAMDRLTGGQAEAWVELDQSLSLLFASLHSVLMDVHSLSVLVAA